MGPEGLIIVVREEPNEGLVGDSRAGSVSDLVGEVLGKDVRNEPSLAFVGDRGAVLGDVGSRVGVG